MVHVVECHSFLLLMCVSYDHEQQNGGVRALCKHIVFASKYTTKNQISIKMLKDVGMTVPKSRETRAVYMQQQYMQQ